MGMKEVLNEVFETGVVLDEMGKTYNPFPISSSRAQCDLLHLLVCESKAKVTLETGFAYGLSSLAICNALQEIGGHKHLIVDPYQATTWHNCGHTLLKKANAGELYQFYEEKSEFVLPYLLTQKLVLDFAYIDANHTFDAALIEFMYIDRMLRRGGIIVLDDMWMPSIQRVASFVTKNLFYDPVHVEACSQNSFAAFRKRAADVRAWDHYVDF